MGQMQRDRRVQRELAGLCRPKVLCGSVKHMSRAFDALSKSMSDLRSSVAAIAGVL